MNIEKIVWMKRSIILVLFVLQIVLLPATAQTRSVPDFTFFKLNGAPFSSKHMLTGKPSLFTFFDVSCSHCQTAMKSLSSRYSMLKNIGVYLVTMDGEDAVLKFMNSYGSNFLNKANVFILQDLKYEFIPKFQPLKYPSVFLYDKNKKLVIYEKDEKKMPQVFEKLKNINLY